MNWRQEYEKARQNPPKKEDILTTKTGDKAKIKIYLKEGETPCLICRAYVDSTVGSTPRWYLRSNYSSVGLKVLIMPNSRDRLLSKYGLEKDYIEISSVKVIKVNEGGKSLLAQVEAY